MIAAVGFVILSLMSLVFSGFEMYGTLKKNRCKIIAAFVFRLFHFAGWGFLSFVLIYNARPIYFPNIYRNYRRDISSLWHDSVGRGAESHEKDLFVIVTIVIAIFFTAWNLLRVILQSITLCCLGNISNDDQLVINTDNKRRHSELKFQKKSIFISTKSNF